MKRNIRNKFKTVFVVLMLLFAVPVFVFASNAVSNNELKPNTKGSAFTLSKKDTYDKSIFMSTYTLIENEGKINGNIVSLSTSISNKGNISGYIIGFSPSLTNNGVVEKSIVGFYNNMYLNNSILKRDLIVYGDKLITDERTVIDGDVTAYTDDILLKGKVGGDVFMVGDSITLNGDIQGDVRVGCNELVLGKNVNIKGSLIYESPNPIVKTDESNVSGGIKKGDLGLNIPVSYNTDSQGLLSSFMSYFSTLNKISVLIIAIILFKLFPISALKIDLFTRRNVFKCLSIGAMTSLFIIPVVILLLITIIGMPMAIHVGSIYYTLTYIALIPTALYLGGLFIKGQNLSFKMLTGIFIMLLLEFLPFTFINSIITLIFNLIGIGSIVMLVSLYLRFQLKREKTEYITLMSINDSRDDIIRTKQKFEQMKNRKFEEAMKRKQEQDDIEKDKKTEENEEVKTTDKEDSEDE